MLCYNQNLFVNFAHIKKQRTLMKATEIFSVYTWMAEIFRRYGELTLHELNELWVKTEMSGGVPMSRHTFTRHRQSMQEMFGFNIVCHKRTNSYSIADDDLHLHNDMQTWMLETLSIGNMLRESASMKKLRPFSASTRTMRAVTMGVDASNSRCASVSCSWAT